jgi:hypothetical protein
LGWFIGISFLPPEIAVGIFIGVTQWLVLRPLFAQTGWWALATSVSWVLGWGVIILFFPPQITTLTGAFIGCVTGVTQWVLLRQWVPQAYWWIVVSTLGWAVGMGSLAESPFVGLIVGITTGIGLELLVRYSSSQA